MIIFLPTPIFAAAGFGSAWMLLWGLSAAIPVLLHLWNRRQRKEMNWAAMRFLMAAVQKNARRVRVEQLILLIVRMGILGLLALALADPFWSFLSGVGAAGPQGKPIHNIIIMDVSYSMGTRDEADTRLAQAKKTARSIVQRGANGDGYSLLLMGDAAQTIIGQPAFEKSAVADELDSLTLLHGGANLQSAFGRSIELIADRQRDGARRMDSRVYVLSDLGRSTWETIETASVRDAIKRLLAEASVTVLDLGRDRTENAAITSVTNSAAITVLNQPVDFRASVRNFGSQPITDRHLELFVDDQLISQRTISLEPDATGAISFRHTFSDARDYRVEIRLAPDPLDVDNRRYLSTVVRPSTRALCIYGKPGAADFVALALSPNKNDDAPMRAALDSEVALLERDLSEFDCVVLCNVGSLGDAEARLLHDYVANGGGLIVFLGDQVQAENYNAQIGPDSNARLLAVTLGHVVTGEQFRLNPRDYDHPIVEVFRGQEQAGLLTTPIWTYVRLSADGTDQAFECAAWIANDPAIVSSVTGQGRVVLVATAASPKSMDTSTAPPMPWTALATWPSFPPLVHEMFSFAAAGRTENRNVIVGEALRSDVGVRWADGPTMLWEPHHQQRVPLSENDSRSWEFDTTLTSGFYVASNDAQPSVPSVYAVNVDTQESDLRRIVPSKLPAEFEYHTALGVSQKRDVDVAGLAPHKGFRTLLWLVLLMVGAESTLAWYFGRNIV